jgi:hypothetical protein
MTGIPGFDDPVLIRLTHEDIRIIKTHACPDEEFLAALTGAKETEDGFLVGCRRECLIDVNCVLLAASEELTDEKEIRKLLRTCDKIASYEFG